MSRQFKILFGYLEHLTFVLGPSQVGPNYNSPLSRCLACHISFENDVARKEKSGLISNALIELAGDSLETLKWTIMQQKFHYQKYDHLLFPKPNQEAYDLCRRQSVERKSSENHDTPPSPVTPNEKDIWFTYRKSSEDPYAIYKDL